MILVSYYFPAARFCGTIHPFLLLVGNILGLISPSKAHAFRVFDHFLTTIHSEWRLAVSGNPPVRPTTPDPESRKTKERTPTRRERKYKYRSRGSRECVLFACSLPLGFAYACWFWAFFPCAIALSLSRSRLPLCLVASADTRPGECLSLVGACC